MPEDRDIERLIKIVTDQVLARLGQADSHRKDRRPGRVMLLVPLVSASLKSLSLQVAEILSQGVEVSVLVEPQVAVELDRLGLRGSFGSRLTSFSDANISQLLVDLDPRDLMVVGSVGFDIGRALYELNDSQPLVRLVSQALLKGTNTAVIIDDLNAVAPGADGRIQRQAADICRKLQALGLRLISSGDLPALFEKIRLTAGTLTQSIDALLTEQDVEKLAAMGERRLRLASKTIVTPLAASRAAELGVEIIKSEE
ncbi:MAG: hypothetical protein JRJ87_08055 [Deltaproteobacteria bacterium]|nr:hypothetical protein [Deltaproteobacteria bacterium]